MHGFEQGVAQSNRLGQQLIATIITRTVVVIMIVFVCLSYARFRPQYSAAGVIVESSS